MQSTAIICRNIAKIAAALLLAAGVARGQGDSIDGINFKGMVRYADNRPAQAIKVELWTDGASTWRTYAITDRDGNFEIGTPCMVIQFKIELPGYRPVSGRQDLSHTPCRASESVTLVPLPGTKASEAAPSAPVDARVASVPPNAKKEFDAGQKAINANDFAGAIPHLQKAADVYPKYAEAYQLLGVAQLQTNQGPQAEASLLKAIEIEDAMPRAQYMLGVLYAMTGRATLAEKPLTRFAELDPQNPDAHFELAKVNFALEKFPDAESQGRKSIDLKETNPGVHVVLGYALLRQKKAAEAKQSFEKFLALDPKSNMAADIQKVIAQIDQRADE